MSRIPIRVRLTLVFAIAMAAVLALVGLVLTQRLNHSITQQIDDRLQTRMTTMSAIVASGDVQAGVSASSLAADDAFARVSAPDGRILATSAGFGIPPIGLDPGRAAGYREFSITEPDGDREPARALTTRVTGQGGAYLVTVGESVTDRRDALVGLRTQLWLLGPVALLLASLLGYLVSGAALRPVELMRRRAASIGADDADARLPLPAAPDEVRRLGETLNDMLDRLDAGLRRERRFVADASHELRTPLALLQTELELATRRPRSAAELDAALRSAKEEVDRLVRLAEDLLVLAAADEGRLPLRPSAIDVAELMQGVVGRFDGRAAQLGREITVTVPDQTSVWADRLRLEQALGNLVDNALRDGRGRVALRTTATPDQIEFCVADEGDGFPGELLPEVFERFTRAGGVRSSGTAGLGLAIVKAIATAHGGSARAANRPGGGAEVTFSIPQTGGSTASTSAARLGALQ